MVIVIAGVYPRTAQKYGVERSPRYVHLEAGHAAQNVLLQAVTLELGAVVIGAFDDAGIREVLGLGTDQQPLYLIPVGHTNDDHIVLYFSLPEVAQVNLLEFSCTTYRRAKKCADLLWFPPLCSLHSQWW